MYRRFHDRFGTAGVVLGVIALIAALGGTAFAASGGLSSKQKKEVKAIAKSFAGKPGAAGAAGTNGANGTNGKDGAPGEDGAPGADGASVTSTESANAIEGHCTGTGTSGKGGSKFVSASGTTYACNGKEGSPWTFGGTLPPNATETGTWALNASPATAGFFGSFATVPISFTVPLAASLTSDKVHFNTDEGFGGICTGTVGAPTAPSGHLCVYLSGSVENATFGGFFNPAGGEGEAGKAGALLLFMPTPETEKAIAFGSWAVTG